MHSAARALAFKSESVFSIVNKSKQRFFSLSFVLKCYNDFHQRQNATNISVFLSHSETLHCENKLANEFSVDNSTIKIEIFIRVKLI